MHTTRFAYYELIKSSPWPALFKVMGMVFFGTTNTTPSADKVEAFEKYLLEGDALGDAVAEDIAKASKESKSFFILLQKTLSTGHYDDDAPNSLKLLIDSVYTDPKWLDREKIENGAAVCRRLGEHAMAVLGDMALLGGYANTEISKPLSFTGALRGNSTFDRVSDTSQFWIDITRKGGLAKGAKGFNSAVHVRIMHSVVRRKLRNHPDWDIEKWGLPINIADSLATNIGFSMGMIYGCKRLGFLFTNKDIEAVLHLWKYVGHLMGDDSSWLPDHAAEGLQCLQIVHLSNLNNPDKDSKALARDYLNSFKPKEYRRNLNFMRKYLDYYRNKGYAQWLIPPDLYLKLELPSYDPLSLMFPLIEYPMITLKEGTRILFPKLAHSIENDGAKAQETLLKERMGNKKASFIPTH
jgi:hypothetical protein